MKKEYIKPDMVVFEMAASENLLSGSATETFQMQVFEENAQTDALSKTVDIWDEEW